MSISAPPSLFRKSSTPILKLLVLFVTIIIGILFVSAGTSHAVGESYQWSDNGSIYASGGAYAEGVIFVYDGEHDGKQWYRPRGSFDARAQCGNNEPSTHTVQITTQFPRIEREPGGSQATRFVFSGIASPCGRGSQGGWLLSTGTMSVVNATDERAACEAAGRVWVNGQCSITGNPDTDEPDDPAGGTEDEEETQEGLLCGGIDSNMRWIACPLTTLLTEILQGVESALHALLQTDTSLFDNPGYQGAWSAFRTIALALVVIAGLVIVTGQAAGVQVLDAYTIKKAVPRLVLAVLFISLSWPLLELVITINDNIARLLEGIVLAPFSGVDSEYGNGESIATGVGNWIGVGGIVALLTPIIAGSTILAGAWGILGSFLLIGVAGVLIAFLVVGLRAVLITICIIAAPLAIACSILPATEKVFDLWRKTLISCLLVYPLIILLLTAGKVGALMSSDGTLSILLYLVPYFAIPFAFTMVGGVIGKLAGIANNVNTGLFDSQRKKREALRGQMGGAFKSGSGFKTNSRFGAVRGVGAAFNATGTAAGLGMRNKFGVGQGIGAEAVGQRNMANAQEMMKSTEFSTISENDNALHALHGIGAGRSRDQVIKSLESRGISNEDATRAYNTAKATRLEGRSASIAAAQQLVLTGTGYKDYEDMVTTLGDAAGGNITTAESLGGFANALTKQKGRHDLAPGGGKAAGDVRQAALGQGVATTNITTTANSDGTSAVDQQAYDRLKASFDSASVYQLANGKGTAIKNTFAPGFTKVMETELKNFAQTGVVSDKLKQSFIVKQELQAALPNASGDNRDAINDALQKMNSIEQTTLQSLGGPSTAGQLSPAQVELENLRKTAAREARAYERPNPNNLQD